MKKVQELEDKTSSNKIYKSAHKQKMGLCPYCKAHEGCNSSHKSQKSWKKFKKTQWKG